MEWETTFRNFVRRAARRTREPLTSPVEQVFSSNYRALHSAQRAGRDLIWLETAARLGRDIADLRPAMSTVDWARREIRIYCVKERALDELMPLLQNLGLRVVDQMQAHGTLEIGSCSIRSFAIEPMISSAGDLLLSKRALLCALNILLSGLVENDILNRLTLLAGLDWRAIDLLRAYCNYYLQLGGRFGRGRVYQALLANHSVVQLLYRYFEARFQPDGRWRNFDQREMEALSPIRIELAAALDAVDDITDDRILRDLFNIIDSTLRTNFYKSAEQFEDYISFKIGSLGVINMPAPRPMVEIYVHSRTMEGIHLRGARVARGGIRWSDRPHDFRVEILDLMQTQSVKNALIVPQGAKGGFVLKIPCANPDQRRRMALDAYKTFIRGLLDLTDNVAGSATVLQPWIVAYDDKDPYLVVAADKGTAAWSDHANEIAAKYAFWLGDAFATGGSHGYHHKRLGVTARGAWVCVRRHFHEIGRDIDRQSFTVAGVGSMDGDVFGNGMLLTPNIRLLAAFSAQHIFLDPDPDMNASYAERRRLFDLPYSTWADYDPALISKGGGVFPRAAKDIALSPEARAWLSARMDSIDGEGLIRLLLTAPVDLLWMGGVGTYVKASFETDESVGDRANDGARVDAVQLRAKIVGEGANLAFTKRARVEYALKGGRINTDAIDNSAGVDLSDHEVNLKILPWPAAMGAAERDRILDGLTNEVCGSVLANNDRQSLCLSLERERCRADVEPYLVLADQLENARLLDRSVDAFPLRKEALARPGRELSRPELAVLMAYSKLALKRLLLEAQNFLQGEWTSDFLDAYFPKDIRECHADRVKQHPLAREIAATMICNKVIDQAGGAFMLLGEGLIPGLLVEAVGNYLAFDRILDGGRWRDALRADGRMTAARRQECLLQLENSLMFLCRWAAQRGRSLLPETQTITEWRTKLHDYLGCFGEGAELPTFDPAAPDDLRQSFSSRLRDFPILVEASRKSHEAMPRVARHYEAVIEAMGLRAIFMLLAEVQIHDSWERRLQRSLDDRFRAAAARIVTMELRLRSDEPGEILRQFHIEPRVARLQRLRVELAEASAPSLASFAAFGAELDSLIDICGAKCGVTISLWGAHARAAPLFRRRRSETRSAL